MRKNYKTTPGQKIDEKVKRDDQFIAVLAIMYVFMILGAIVGICLKS